MSRQFRFAFALLLALACPSIIPAATFPDFIYTTDNGALKLASLRGKVIYVDYWASWCGPCRQSFPWMNEMQARYRDRGLVVLAVNVDRELAEAKRFLANYPANFLIAYDSKGDTANTLALQGMPNSFLVDRRGEIIATHVGFREADKAKNEAAIKAALAH